MNPFKLAISQKTDLIKFPLLTFLLLRILFYIPGHDLYFSKTLIRDAPKNIAVANSLDQGTVRPRIALFSLGVISLFIIWRSRSRPLRFKSPLGYLFIAFGAWAMSSYLWAENPDLTLRRIVAAIMLSLGAMACAKRFSLREVILFAFFCGAISGLVSLIIELALGTFRPFAMHYRFAGTQHPNELGRDLAIMLISAVALFQSERKWRRLFFISICIAFICLILTKSRTAMFASVFAILGYIILRAPFRLSLASIFGCVSFSFLFFIILPEYSMNFLLLGREMDTLGSLTNRIPLWENLLYYVGENPILGYGFNGFWTTERVYNMFGDMGWYIFHSHNTFIEVALGLGIFGATLYVAILILLTIRAISYYERYKNPVYAYFVVMLIFSWVTMMLEVLFFTVTIPSFLSLVILIKLALAPNDTRYS